MHPYIDLESFCISAQADYEGLGLYCLADHAGIPGLILELEKAHVEWISLFEGSAERNALVAAPLLFSLNKRSQSHNHFLRWLSEKGTYTSVLSFLATPLTLDELAHRLSMRLNASISDNMNVMCRFFDPRVFESLMLTLSEESKNKFLSVASAWWYLDRAGFLKLESGHFSAVEMMENPWSISADEEFALVNASEVDQIMAATEELVSDIYLRLSSATRAQTIARLAGCASDLGIQPIAEKALYCALALTHGEDFFNLPEWQPVIEKLHEGVSFSDAVIAME